MELIDLMSNKYDLRKPDIVFRLTVRLFARVLLSTEPRRE